MTHAEAIRVTINTLNQIEVKGETNCSRLLASIQMLGQIASDLEKLAAPAQPETAEKQGASDPGPEAQG